MSDHDKILCGNRPGPGLCTHKILARSDERRPSNRLPKFVIWKREIEVSVHSIQQTGLLNKVGFLVNKFTLKLKSYYQTPPQFYNKILILDYIY